MKSNDPTVSQAGPDAGGDAPEAEAGPAPEARSAPSWLRWVILAAAAVALYFVVGALGERLPAAFAWVEGLGAWGPIGYVALYVGATVLMVPGLVMTLAGGALFGLAAGTAWVFIGATIGSGGAFLVGRYLARSRIEHRIAGNPRFDAIDRAVGADGLRMVFLLRLSPVFPFVFLNYALGLTRVRFRDYMLAAFGMLPGTVLYVYYGALIGDVARVAGGVQKERGPLEWSLMILGLAATFGVTWLVTKRARAALAEVDALKDAEADARETG
jgi:uncharacterized membrane protein YdjX (TVP38/TMEM64 family)